MRMLDRHGRPLPLDAWFASHRRLVQMRAGLVMSRILQRRARRKELNETAVLMVRRSDGTAATLTGDGCDVP